MADIFISFIHEEKEVAEAVQRFVRAKLRKWQTFLSSDKSIYAGEEWLKRIKEELASAKIVILILS